ncbi:MAG TPA: PEP-CTERM sorting domain-containing protein [Chromatiaceae bacterium]|nr:PEP-CTERM sorting domain-containing protein [Chromatiaceae bacterium]
MNMLPMTQSRNSRSELRHMPGGLSHFVCHVFAALAVCFFASNANADIQTLTLRSPDGLTDYLFAYEGSDSPGNTFSDITAAGYSYTVDTARNDILNEIGLLIAAEGAMTSWVTSLDSVSDFNPNTIDSVTIYGIDSVGSQYAKYLSFGDWVRSTPLDTESIPGTSIWNHHLFIYGSQSVSAVPEPSTSAMLLLGAGLFALHHLRRRRMLGSNAP